VIIWLNGTFGAGKTTTAKRLAERLEQARLFDVELVGDILMEALKDHDFADYQDLPPWRELVPVITDSIAAFTGQQLIAPHTVLNEAYWTELSEGFGKRSLDIFHVLLHVDTEALTARIEADDIPVGARQWRLDHIRDYEKSRSWMESAADIVIDTTDLPVADVAERIAIEADQRLATANLG
jgi:shikimate kinase